RLTAGICPAIGPSDPWSLASRSTAAVREGDQLWWSGRGGLFGYPAGQPDDLGCDVGDSPVVCLNAVGPAWSALVERARHQGTAFNVLVQCGADLALAEPMMGRCIAASEEDCRDMRVVADRGRKIRDHFLEHARGVRVDHPAVAERVIIGPHRGQVLL